MLPRSFLWFIQRPPVYGCLWMIVGYKQYCSFGNTICHIILFVNNYFQKIFFLRWRPIGGIFSFFGQMIMNYMYFYWKRKNIHTFFLSNDENVWIFLRICFFLHTFEDVCL